MCLAVPGELVGVEGGDPLKRTGSVAFSGLVKQVSLALLPDARVGDYVLVHAGFAISVMSQEEADRALAYFDELAVSCEGEAGKS